MSNQPEKFLKLNELIESHLNPIKMTVDLHQQILQSFLLLCKEKDLVDNSTGETFYPIPYQEITECIYSLEFEFSNELNSVIEGLIEPLKKLLNLNNLTEDELKLEKNKYANHQLNAYKRFVSHIQLAVCQKKFIGNQILDVILQVNQIKQDNKKLTKDLSDSKDNISDLKAEIFGLENDLRDAKKLLKDSRDIIISSVKEAESANTEAKSAKESVHNIVTTLEDIQSETSQALQSAHKAQKDAEDSKTQFVTILGIFASIIVALFGGMSLVKAAVELLTNEGSLPLFVFVVSVLMLSFSGLIVLLTTWITSLNKEKSEESYLYTKIILFGFLIICCFGSGLISYDLSNKPKAEKEKSSADIKLELKTNQ